MKPGEVATDLIELIDHEFESLDEVGQRIVANRLLERLVGWIPPRPNEPPITPMTDIEARRFDGESMQFGKHSGQCFCDIDTDYLAWLADSSRDLWRKLHAYLRSDLVRSRAAAGGTND